MVSESDSESHNLSLLYRPPPHNPSHALACWARKKTQWPPPFTAATPSFSTASAALPGLSTPFQCSLPYTVTHSLSSLSNPYPWQTTHPLPSSQEKHIFLTKVQAIRPSEECRKTFASKNPKTWIIRWFLKNPFQGRLAIQNRGWETINHKSHCISGIHPKLA